ncbi:HSF-type DNA-binding protein [Nitzschia inconspicua]|uniref:HSF-type DNA-binding protein n=1 Tax=Nitzschia inconspicua TaxID=303405 RepID=A0A9K3KG08_9STRA|nr:HSF-type DNA-binding protein [Nitzschia inconspicua]
MERISIIIPPKPGHEHEYPKDQPITLDICSDSMASLSKDADLPSSKLPFTWKLYEMLEDVEENGQDHIISWVNNGKGFQVHNLDLFVEQIIPIYFKQSKYKSFQRQLYFYNFKRVSKGAAMGSYYHPMFVRGNKTRCLSITPKKACKNKKINDNPCEDRDDMLMNRVVPRDEPTTSSIMSANEQETKHSIRRVLPSRMPGQSEANLDKNGKQTEVYDHSGNIRSVPAVVPLTSMENSKNNQSEQCQQLQDQPRGMSRRQLEGFRNDEDLNDGVACDVFGSMIFHFVRGVPQV